MGKGLKKAAGDISKGVTKAVRDVGKGAGTLVGKTVSQLGRTVGDDNLITTGKKTVSEVDRGIDKWAPLLTSIAGNALVPGYSALGALASGDIKGAALSALGASSLDPNLLKTISAGLTGDKAGLASGLAGYAGLSSDTTRALSGLASGNTKDLAMGLLGSTGYLDDLKSMEQSAKESLRGFLPDMSGAQPYLDAAKYLMPQGSGNISEEEEEQIVGDFSSYSKGDQNSAYLSSLFDSFGNFIGENKSGIGTGLGLLGQGLNYNQYKDKWDIRKSIIDSQLGDLAGVGKDFQSMKYDPNRYEEYNKYLQDVVTGKGIGAEEKKMQQEGDIRAGRAASSQRAAALEQMARMGSGASGSGAALASALAGGQSAMGIQSQTNLEREASAQRNLERAIQGRASLSTQKTKEEADLAYQQGVQRLAQLQQMGVSRENLAALHKELADTRNQAVTAATGTGLAYLNQVKSSEEAKKAAEAARRQMEADQYAARLRELDLQKKQAEIDNISRQQIQTQQTQPKQTPLPSPYPSQSEVSKALNTGSYVIQKGDSLSKRYKDLGYSTWRELYEANKDLIGDDPNKIKAGNTLRRKEEVGAGSTISTPIQDMNKKYSGYS